ncbi:MAG: leucyl/phenylalanyl-tRNA--protein transferase [Succinivibrionaceae bacterium]|nr:leucyl/phenylalanyl-tRNA--protein transferase [Succinivibrionaceae bacterium]
MAEERSDGPENYIRPELLEKTPLRGIFTPSAVISRPWLEYAYSHGVFPMALTEDPESVIWMYPDERAVFFPERIRPSRSMMKFMRRSLDAYTVWINRRPRDVIRACMEVHGREEDTWINDDFVRIYPSMPNYVSVEVCDRDDRLVGGLYGLALGRLFAGESMFSLETNVSKLAFHMMMLQCRLFGMECFDSQIINPHTRSLGCEVIANRIYRKILNENVRRQIPEGFLRMRQIYPDPALSREDFLDRLLTLFAPV